MKVVLVGFGSIGKRHYKNLSMLSKDKILICTKQKIDRNKKDLEIFHSIEDCLKEKPEIALVTNVTNLHVNVATKVANAGCHIFIEKPLSNSLSGLQNLSLIHI